MNWVISAIIAILIFIFFVFFITLYNNNWSFNIFNPKQVQLIISTVTNDVVANVINTDQQQNNQMNKENDFNLLY
jgi:hypothetical protein